MAAPPCKSAVAEATATADYNARGEPIPEFTYWDHCAEAWLPLQPWVTYGCSGAIEQGYLVDPEACPDALPEQTLGYVPVAAGGQRRKRPAPQAGGGLIKLGLGAVAVGALGYALWRR